MKYLLVVPVIFSLACSQVKLSSNPSGDPLAEANTGKDVVLVGKTTIKDGTLDFLAEINPRVGAQLKNPVAKKKLVENLVEQELLYQEALKRGLDQDKQALTKAALYKKIIISQALVDAEVEKKAKTYYEDKKASEFTTLEAAQITIDWLITEPTSDTKDNKDNPEPKVNREPTEAEKQKTLEKAKQIKARLTAGEDFAKVAEEVSDDKATKKKGGSIGDISIDDKRLARRGMENVGPAAFKMKKDEISDPIEVKKGYVIVKVLSDQKNIAFEDAKKGIEMQITKQVKDELVAELTKNTTIVYADDSLKSDKKEGQTEHNDHDGHNHGAEPAGEALPAPEGATPPLPPAGTQPAAPAPEKIEAPVEAPKTTETVAPTAQPAPEPTPGPAPAPAENHTGHNH